ncbi:MAG: nucleoside-diphosphate kinase [Geodermatophilaceae bacterium]|nr:nucleoside-diphosphate kinase [Geodermatophilaceae bacterium]
MSAPDKLGGSCCKPRRTPGEPVSERTLILIKPDGVGRGLVGEVISRIERKGLTLLALELRTLDPDTAQRHYAEHEAKPFFADLVEFITSGPLVALVAEGPRAVSAFRQLAGATDPVAAATGSIRGDFALAVQNNIVHGSDSAESAAREIGLFFPDV